VIVFLHGAPAFGAVEEYVVAVARGLRERGRDVALIYPRTEGLESFDELSNDGVRTENFPVGLLRSTPRLIGHLRGRLRALEPDIAHVTDVWPAGSIAARLAGAPRLFLTYHTPELPRNDNASGRLWSRLGWLARPTVVYTSHADLERDGRRALKRRVVPLGIDVERFESATPSLERAGPLIGNVARLAAQKGQDTIIDAAPAVLSRHPGARFVFAGDGELRAELERRAAELGVAEHVEFLGHRSDVPQILASLDAFAFPSRFEGLCLAVIEAQVAGVPVVASPVGGIRETVVPGETGYLCAPGDATSLASAICRILEVPGEARALAVEARRRARKYTIERMIAETDALYG
jgi:glycosyltransferase involved in cell wall biosynthesis